MNALWQEFRAFLAQRALIWIGLVVAFYALLALVAWLQADRPDAPFIYQVF